MLNIFTPKATFKYLVFWNLQDKPQNLFFLFSHKKFLLLLMIPLVAKYFYAWIKFIFIFMHWTFYKDNNLLLVSSERNFKVEELLYIKWTVNQWIKCKNSISARPSKMNGKTRPQPDITFYQWTSEWLLLLWALPTNIYYTIYSAGIKTDTWSSSNLLPRHPLLKVACSVT